MPSVVGECLRHHGVGITDAVEVGQVETLPKSMLAPDRPFSSAAVPSRSLWRGKRKRCAPHAPVAALQRPIEFDDESDVLPK